MADLYEYFFVNVSLEPLPEPEKPYRKPTIATAANRWAKMGWRTVGVIPAKDTSYADAILVERLVEPNEERDSG